MGLWELIKANRWRFTSTAPIALVLAVLWEVARRNGAFSAVTAAWVQAIGSIAAILVGFSLVTRELGESRRRDVEAKAAAQRDAFSVGQWLAGLAVARLEIMAERLANGAKRLDVIRATLAVAETDLRIVQAFDPTAMRSVVAMQRFTQFSGSLAGACQTLRLLMDEMSAQPQSPHLDAWAETLREVREILGVVRDRLPAFQNLEL